MILFLTGRAEVLEEYQTLKIRSVSACFNLPKILRLFSPFKRQTQIKFCRENIYIRDKFKCQYCDIKLPRKQLTLDHVLPKSKGGQNTWKNLVTCCEKCNCRKGDKLLDNFHLNLNKIPIEPKWNPYMLIKITDEDPDEWWSYLGIFKPNVKSTA